MAISPSFFTSKKFIILGATLCCLLWGSAYPAIKGGYLLFNIAADDVPSKFVFAGYRFFLAGIVVLIYAKYINHCSLVLTAKQLGQSTLLGLTQTSLQYTFFYVGLAHTTGTTGSIMNATSTFFSVLLAHFIYKNDKLSFNKALGCLVGLIGVMVVNIVPGQFSFSFNLLGEGFVIISAFLLSSTAIYGKKISQSLDPVVLTGYQLTIGGGVLTIVGYLFGGEISTISIPAIILMIYMVLLSSVAFALWTLLLKYNRVSQVAPFNFLIPVSGAVLSSIFLGENIFVWKNLLALFLVCLGIWLVNKISYTNKIK